MKSICFPVIVGLILSVAVPAGAQNTVDTRATLAGLDGVAIQVVPTPDEIAEKGISATVLAVEVERVLKEGGVPIHYPEPPDSIAEGPLLSLEVIALLDEYVDQIVYTVSLELVQPVVLARDSTRQVYNAPTWSVSGTGVYGSGWRQAIIDDVVSFSTQFVAAYADANPPFEE